MKRPESGDGMYPPLLVENIVLSIKPTLSRAERREGSPASLEIHLR